MDAVYHLANVLEWAKGNRGSKSCDPYSVPEIENALHYLAETTGSQDWLKVDTDRLSRADQPSAQAVALVKRIWGYSQDDPRYIPNSGYMTKIGS